VIEYNCETHQIFGETAQTYCIMCISDQRTEIDKENYITTEHNNSYRLLYAMDLYRILILVATMSMYPFSSIVSYERTPRNSRISGAKRTHFNMKSDSSDEIITARNECDSHADTCCAGRNWIVIDLSDMECNVKGFSNELGMLSKIPIASVGTLWVNPENGCSYILVIHEALYFGDDLDHSLINPNQIRLHLGNVVQDNPLNKAPMGIQIEQVMFIPFKTSGVTIYWESTKPSKDDLEKYNWLELTENKPWIPSMIQLSHGSVDDNGYDMSDRDVFEMSLQRCDDDYESDYVLEKHFGSNERLICQRMICSVRSTSAVRSNDRHSKHTPEHIARVFDITEDKARDMLSKTTQQTIRMGVIPITRRYRSFNIDPNEFRLAGQWVIDYLEASVKSIRQHIGAFVITNGRFVYVLPTPKQTDEYATKALTMFSAEVGIPTEIKSDLHLSFTGKHTQFQQFLRSKHITMYNSESGRHGHTYKVDTEIRELRRRSRKKMISKNVPRRLWCLMLEWQSRMMQFIPRGYNERTGYLSQLCRMSACRFCCPNGDILCRVGDMSRHVAGHVADTRECRVGRVSKTTRHLTTCRGIPDMSVIS
jgi:hypothetical protein